MLSLFESIEVQIIGVWAICSLFGFYLYLEESH
jgi:hypothetical protein